MGQYCFALLASVVCHRHLSASFAVICYAVSGQAGQLPGRAHGRSGGRHCMAGQYSYVPLGRHLVVVTITTTITHQQNSIQSQFSFNEYTLTYSSTV